MKSKIWLVAQREFATRVKKKSFIIMTILMPFLMAALMFLPLLLSMIKDGGSRTVALIDNTGRYAPAFENTEEYKFVRFDKMETSFRSDSTDIDAVVHIVADLVDFPNTAAIYSRREVPADLSSYVKSVLSEEVRKEKFERYDIPALNDIIEDIQQPIEVSTVRWTDDGGEQESMSEITAGVGMLLTFLIYMFVLSYGAMVMQSVIEEKTNRIVELMVSSVRPIQLMMGKIIGIGLVGIMQMAIWGVLLFVIVAIAGVVAGMPVGAAPGMADMAAMQPTADYSELAGVVSVIKSFPLFEIGSLFVLYFIGGYLLYASILAAFGASISEQQDSGQLMMPVMVLMVFAFYAGFYSAQNPEGPLAFWCSFIPFTSSIVMMVRIPFGVPFYHELLSVLILYGTALLILWVSSKIYRVGILMYGKKPSYKEMLKWIRYK